MKKKIIALLLALTVICAFASCGGGDNDTDDDGPKLPFGDGGPIELDPVPIEPTN